MNPSIETALKDLEQSTQALLETNMDDVAAIGLALERRADALTRVAALVEDSTDVDGAAQRLALAVSRGEEAKLRALNIKRDATEEWISLNRILKGLDNTCAHEKPSVDCSA